MSAADSAPLVLAVCTGNICRSPVAERLLARRAPGMQVRSAGTRALVGRPIEPPLADRLRSAGVDPTRFAARRLTAEMLQQAGLVLTMTLEQRAATVDLWPAAVRRTFTLRELARLLCGGVGEERPTGPATERLPELVALAASRRHRVSEPPGIDDIADPYGRDDAAYGAAYAQIDQAVRLLAPVLGSPG